ELEARLSGVRIQPDCAEELRLSSLRVLLRQRARPLPEPAPGANSRAHSEQRKAEPPDRQTPEPRDVAERVAAQRGGDEQTESEDGWLSEWRIGDGADHQGQE